MAEIKSIVTPYSSEEMRQIGIYAICNKWTGKMYIGSAASKFGFKGRLWFHLNDLNKNNHHSIKLQNSFNKYPSGYFEYKILEVCDKEHCLEREQYYLNNLLYANKNSDEFKVLGYNVSRITRNPGGKKGNGKVYQISKNNLTVVDIFNHANEAKEKTRIVNIVNCLKGRRTSAGGFYWCYVDKLEEFIPRKNNYKGVYSEEHRQNIRIINSKRLLGTTKNSKFPVLQFDVNGNFIKEWNKSIIQIGKELKISGSGIGNCVNNRNHTSGGFVWKYKIEN